MKKWFEVGPGLACDVDRLVASRLLIQANSGGGKTRTLRRLLEQSHGRLQHLVIDPEGEYHTLREKFDYVLAAPTGGDTVAHPRTAAMLAERLLQLNVSAILDIYELNPDQRVLFVQRFLESLVNAPRNLWHPVLVVLDEAHVYAPEGSQSTSASAVKAMASRGRKRGFCLVPATQRLSKLSKDVAAECNNKLIGRCTLDVDIKRAAEELGFATNDQRQQLRQLEPGQFYAYGPAFDVKAPILVHVGAVTTSHPEPGQKAAPVPAPTDKVKKVLQQLADLPAEAEEREKSISELRKDVAEKDRRIKQLERERATSAPNIPATIPATKPVPALTDADRALLAKLESKLIAIDVKANEIATAVEQRATRLIREALDEYTAATRNVGVESAKLVADIFNQASVKKLLEKLNGLAPAARLSKPAHIMRSDGQTNAVRTPSIVPSPKPQAPSSNGDGSISPVQQRILNALAELDQLGAREPERELVAFMANYTHLQSKGFVNAMSSLSTAGLISYGKGTVMLTTAGRAAAQWAEAPRTAKEVQDRVIAMLGGASGRILQPLIEAYPNALDRQDVAARAGYGHLQSKGFVNAISRLRTLGFVDYPDRGTIIAKPVLFLEGSE